MARLLFMVLLMFAGAPALGGPEACERAIRTATAEAGLPPDLLMAIALAESGRVQDGRLRPWPWAANLEGRGHWFSTRAELVAFAEGAIAAGRRSIDIGCFQINWHWHGAAFARPNDLAEPLTGARHAAGYLLRLHAETGSWERAVGAYHSRDPERAARYAARVAELGGWAPAPGPLQASQPASQPAAARLRAEWHFRPGSTGGETGSLMSLSPSPTRFIPGIEP
jgi:hypothetical protein